MHSLYQHVDVSTAPEELDRLVRAVHHTCRRGIDERLWRYGISVVQWHALQTINDNPGLPLRRLARLTGHSDQGFGTPGARRVLTLLFLPLREADRQSLQVLLRRLLEGQWRLQLEPLPESAW